MAKIDLARRAEIGREKRARTRAQIVEAGAMLLAERPPEALTVDAVVEAAGVAKGTFYYHFQSIDELAAAVGAKLGESFDEMLTPARLKFRIRSIACLSRSRNSWNERFPTQTGRASWFRARNPPLTSVSVSARISRPTLPKRLPKAALACGM